MNRWGSVGEAWGCPPPHKKNFIFKCFEMPFSLVGEMVQNSQSLYSFTFTAVIVTHEYIYSHSTTKFTFKKYICLH